MKKTFFIARYEYWRFARRKGFVFVVLGLPLLMLAAFAVIFLVFSSRENRPVGAVDETGILIAPDIYAEIDASPPFVIYTSEVEARAALVDEDIQAYFVVPAGYLTTGDILVFHAGDASEDVNGEISDYLRTSLLAGSGVAEDLASRLGAGGLDTQFISLLEERSGNEIASFLFPFFLGLLLMMSIFTTGGYMLQAVVDEKENRTMEILLTSVTPEQLMTGKMAGLVCLGMTQILVWTSFLLVGFLIIRTNVPELSLIVPPFDMVALGVAWFVPYYIIYACFMAIVGLSVTEVSEGQQAAGIFSLLAAIPFWFMLLLITAPDSTVAVALSLIPFTSPFSILIRYGLTTIPPWQMILSWLLLAGTAVFTIYLVGQVMRLGMLRYGQRLTVRQILGGIRSS
jgi:ABC-2 type transport system permease protein